MIMRRFAPLALLLLAAASTSCGGGGGTDGLAPTDDSTPAVTAPPTITTPTAPAPTIPATSSPTGDSPAPAPRSPLASKIGDIGEATYEPTEHLDDAPIPARLSVPDVGVDEANVESVGVLLDGRFEVPDARLVGWYRYGPTPLENGTTVLAGHLNYDGVDGVFRRLADVDVGAEVVVTLTDGQPVSYRVTEVRLIDKNLLPPDEIWNRDGVSRLVLITCGGRYDASRRSYDDNVVVFADPI